MSKKILTFLMILVFSALTACAGTTRKAEIAAPVIQPVMHQTPLQNDPGTRDTSSEAGL